MKTVTGLLIVRLAARIALVGPVILATALTSLNERDSTTASTKAFEQHIVTVPTRMSRNSESLVNLLPVVTCVEISRGQ